VFPLKDNIPTDRVPVVTIFFILANVVAYFLLQKGGILHGPDNAGVIKYGAIPYELTHPNDLCSEIQNGAAIGCGASSQVPDQPSTWLTPFTAMFMHGSVVHLGGNMLFLWIFGNNVEDSMGPVRFVLFYVLGGLAALLGQVIVGPNEAVPTIGASGAVAGVLGGYILLWPKARVLTLVFIIFFVSLIELPAMVMLGIWFAQQILFGAADLTDPTGGSGGVAYFAHIGGFLWGLVVIRAFAQRVKQVPPRIPVY
jgi:membrane associated rhomboid family serine protease